MRREFMAERNGRTFILYAGLLDLAHQQGLISLLTELVQIPGPDNGGVAICRATATLTGPAPYRREGEDTRVFTGTGDAAINNVAPAMATCLIRMAETRAKARALRDAVNIGGAAFEELGTETVGDDSAERPYVHQPAPRVRSAAAGRPEPQKPAPRIDDRGLELASEDQIKAIRSLCSRGKIEEPDGLETALTAEEAAALIKALNKRG